MDYKKLAEECIALHMKPMQKMEPTPQKYFRKETSESAIELLNKRFSELKTVLSQIRVERRSIRLYVELLPNSSTGTVLRASGVCKNFGYQNKSGKFLHPEEILFLLETNKLELKFGGAPCSMLDAFYLIFNNATDLSLNRYLAYKKLTIYGYRLKHLTLKEVDSRKRKSVCNENDKLKIAKVSAESDLIGDIFARLQAKGPRTIEPVEDTSPVGSYTFQAHSTEFNLSISSAEYFRELSLNDGPTIYGLGPHTFCGFYQFLRIPLPVCKK